MYISYLDSVTYFRPKHLRTAVYREILLSYLQYARGLGYSTVHIWACPPSEGKDYIFHVHPQHQKTPTPTRLHEWYDRLLQNAVEENIIVDYVDIGTNTLLHRIDSLVVITYFQEDYWPIVLDTLIKVRTFLT